MLRPAADRTQTVSTPLPVSPESRDSNTLNYKPHNPQSYIDILFLFATEGFGDLVGGPGDGAADVGGGAGDSEGGEGAAARHDGTPCGEV